MSHPKTSWPAIGLLSGAVGLALVAAVPAAIAAPAARTPRGPAARRLHNLVVIYEENHSFDNLYGQWGRVGGRVVDGLQNAGGTTTQVAQDGTAYGCLLQNDVNLTSPSPLATTCTDPAHGVPASHFGNTWFTIDKYIQPSDTTCPAPGVFAPNGVLNGTGEPGGCTRDLVHRFYQEQYQIDGGKQDRYVTGSDAVGLTMGRYATTTCRSTSYLHSKGAPNYVVADRFFQGAFGGSFLNHQYLIAARAPRRHRRRHPDGGQTRWSTATGCRRSLPPLHRHRRGQGRPAHPGVQQRQALRLHRRPAATSPSTPCSRRALRPAAARRSR